MKKPVLIIGCSGAKHETSREAYNLYTGSIFTLLNSKLGGPEEVLKHFDVCILSAKHGLVTHHRYLEPYNEKMPKQRNKLGHQRYKQKHGILIKKTINKLSSRDRDIFIVLINDYQFALDNAFDGQLEKHLNSKFRTYYVSRSHQGIGDMRGRINRIAKLAKNRTQIDVCTFRSSISNLNELGYLAAGADFGSSLAYCNIKHKCNGSLIAPERKKAACTSIYEGKHQLALVFPVIKPLSG